MRMGRFWSAGKC